MYIQRFHSPLILKVLLFGWFFITYSQNVLADKIDDFIQSIHVATYDCPDDLFMPQVDEYLNHSSILPEQRIKIKVHKSHWLICVGKNDEAQIMLENLLSDPKIDKRWKEWEKQERETAKKKRDETQSKPK